VGRERRRYKGKNIECKDARAVAKALVVNKPMAIFHARYGKL
jgi:hypothetical protein